jgi:hypothetical protein
MIFQLTRRLCETAEGVTGFEVIDGDVAEDSGYDVVSFGVSLPTLRDIVAPSSSRVK